jgi:Domain of unknown function (DUF6473)
VVPKGRYVAVLGGSATFGKGVAEPYPALVQAATGIPVLNLGVQNCGPDVYLSDPEVLTLIVRAEAAVVQLTGVETLSNPFYKVHSRRNDRFLAATPALRALFPDVDFTEFHFTRHLLQTLAHVDADRFGVVARALKTTWVQRMQHLLVHLPLRRQLLWLSDGAPPDRVDRLRPGPGPLLVDAGMLASLRPLAGDVLVAVPGPEAQSGASGDAADATWGGGPNAGLPGSAAHRDVAAVLGPGLLAQLRRGTPAPLILRQTDAVR